MKDSQLKFDRTCHVLYSKPCKRQIQEKIALHYPADEREAVWTRVQIQYENFLADWRTDLGGKRNFHNGRGGTYDCIALMAYYVVCRDVTSLAEIEKMEGSLFLPAFRKLRFVNVNHPFFKKLLHRAFLNAKRRCDKWGDYDMHVAPYRKDQPIYYEFTACPPRSSRRSTACSRSCPRCATRISRAWNFFTQSSCARPPAPTAASATTPYAAIRTRT